jgi:hypothetical protein
MGNNVRSKGHKSVGSDGIAGLRLASTAHAPVSVAATVYRRTVHRFTLSPLQCKRMTEDTARSRGGAAGPLPLMCVHGGVW